MKKFFGMAIALFFAFGSAQAQSQKWIEEVDRYIQDDTALDYYMNDIDYNTDNASEAAAMKASAQSILGEWWYFYSCYDFKSDGTFVKHELIQSSDKAIRIMSIPGTWELAKGVLTLKSDNKNATATLHKQERIKKKEDLESVQASVKRFEGYQRDKEDSRAVLKVYRLDDKLVMSTVSELEGSDEDFFTSSETLIRPSLAR